MFFKAVKDKKYNVIYLIKAVYSPLLAYIFFIFYSGVRTRAPLYQVKLGNNN